MIVIAPRQPWRPRVPADIDPEAGIKDVADGLRLAGLRLVTDGKRVYVTPIVMPGEFTLAEAA